MEYTLKITGILKERYSGDTVDYWDAGSCDTLEEANAAREKAVNKILAAYNNGAVAIKLGNNVINLDAFVSLNVSVD